MMAPAAWIATARLFADDRLPSGPTPPADLVRLRAAKEAALAAFPWAGDWPDRATATEALDLAETLRDQVAALESVACALEGGPMGLDPYIMVDRVRRQMGQLDMRMALAVLRSELGEA
jgi:hypothetical protein